MVTKHLVVALPERFLQETVSLSSMGVVGGRTEKRETHGTPSAVRKRSA